MNQPSLVLSHDPVDALVVKWSRAANSDEDLRSFLGGAIAVACDYADIIVVLEKSMLEQVSQDLALLEIPEDYIQFVGVSEVTNPFSWLFKNDDGNVELLKTANNSVDSEFLSVLTAQEEFFSAKITNHALSGLRSTDLAVTSDGVAFMDAAIFERLVTNVDGEALAELLGAQKIIPVTVPSQFTALAQILRIAQDNSLLVVNSAHSELQQPCENLRESLSAALDCLPQKYKLVDQWLPDTILNDYPAAVPSYNDFLVINEAVLVPQFDCEEDEMALEIIYNAFPGREIFGIPVVTDRSQPISLHSSLSCLPEGTLFPFSQNE